LVSSDRDVEMVNDPSVEQREWRLRKAAGATGDRIPPRTVGIRGGTPEARDATDRGKKHPRGHAEEACRAAMKNRRNFRA